MRTSGGITSQFERVGTDPLAETAESAVDRVFAWVPVAGLILLLCGSTRRVLRPLEDPDTWWHLRLGEDFWNGRSLQDPGQWTRFATAEWVPTQWLTEMVASKTQDIAGLPGVAWLWGLTTITLLIGIYLVCRQEAGRLVAALVTGLAFLGGSGSLTPRPHMVTYVFLIITIGAWLQSARDGKPRWWLIPLTWLWACSHGMWFVGPTTGLVIVLGMILDHGTKASTALRLLIVPLASVCAAALTPTGPKLLGAPFAVSDISQYITEWAAPSIRDPGPALTVGMIGIVVIAWTRGRRIQWSKIGLLVLAAGWTALSARTVTLGAIIVAPLLAGVVQAGVTPRGSDRLRRSEIGVIFAAAAAILALMAAILPGVAIEPGKVPSRLNAQISALPAGTTVYNDYEIGGWLLWEHQQVIPVIDGLTESYTPAYLEEHRNTRGAAPDWPDSVRSSGASYALLSETSPLQFGLQHQLGWAVVGEDAGYLLLKAPWA